jgi:hypothetical protein
MTICSPRREQPTPTRTLAGAGCITVSYRPAIPRRVAPQQSPLPLRRHRHFTSPSTPGIVNVPANLRLSFGTFYSPSTPGIANVPANLFLISCLTTGVHPIPVIREFALRQVVSDCARNEDPKVASLRKFPANSLLLE